MIIPWIESSSEADLTNGLMLQPTDSPRSVQRLKCISLDSKMRTSIAISY